MELDSGRVERETGLAVTFSKRSVEASQFLSS
jgi:hypothetical protein